MILTISPNSVGGFVVSAPDRWTKKIIKHMKDMHGKEYMHNGTVYLQGEWELPDWLSRRHRKDLEEGWDIRVRVDNWEALHLWGWDAHTLAE